MCVCVCVCVPDLICQTRLLKLAPPNNCMPPPPPPPPPPAPRYRFCPGIDTHRRLEPTTHTRSPDNQLGSRGYQGIRQEMKREKSQRGSPPPPSSPPPPPLPPAAAAPGFCTSAAAALSGSTSPLSLHSEPGAPLTAARFSFSSLLSLSLSLSLSQGFLPSTTTTSLFFLSSPPSYDVSQKIKSAESFSILRTSLFFLVFCSSLPGAGFSFLFFSFFFLWTRLQQRQGGKRTKKEILHGSLLPPLVYSTACRGCDRLLKLSTALYRTTTVQHTLYSHTSGRSGGQMRNILLLLFLIY